MYLMHTLQSVKDALTQAAHPNGLAILFQYRLSVLARANAPRLAIYSKTTRKEVAAIVVDAYGNLSAGFDADLPYKHRAQLAETVNKAFASAGLDCRLT